jgi:uncharacterized protein (TIGR02284 family)
MIFSTTDRTEGNPRDFIVEFNLQWTEKILIIKTTNMKNAEALNDLIEINNDRVVGYNKAAGETSDEDLRSLFTGYAEQSRQFASDLKQLVRGEGEDPAEGTTLKGKIYRTWMDVKHKFEGDSRKGVLASCEFGEDAAQAAYKQALAGDDLDADVRILVETQKATLRQAHDKIKAMRDAQPA